MAGKSKITEERALKLGAAAAEELGVYIVDVSYDGGVLCYYIDRDGGVDIDICESFSRTVEKTLDEADIIEGGYSLEVSSPGVDRKLKKEREFRYYIGREVEVKLYAANEDGLKEFDGILKDFHDKTAVIERETEEVEVPLKNAVYIRLKFVF